MIATLDWTFTKNSSLSLRTSHGCLLFPIISSLTRMLVASTTRPAWLESTMHTIDNCICAGTRQLTKLILLNPFPIDHHQSSRSTGCNSQAKGAMGTYHHEQPDTTCSSAQKATIGYCEEMWEPRKGCFCVCPTLRNLRNLGTDWSLQQTSSGTIAPCEVRAGCFECVCLPHMLRLYLSNAALFMVALNMASSSIAELGSSSGGRGSC